MSHLRPVGAFVWVAASVMLGAGLYAGYRAAPDLSPFVLESIRVEGAVRTTRDDVIRAAGLRPGVGLFDLDVGQLRRDVEKLPWVRRARVVRQIPSALQVQLEEWSPRCLVRLDRLYYLSVEGHVIRAALEEGVDYPVVTGLTRADLEGGGPLATGLRELLAVLDQGLLQEEASELHADPEAGFTVYTPSAEGTAIRLGFTDFEPKLRRLERLRRHLARRGQTFYSVNLNHEDKIIARLLPAAGKAARP